MVSIVGGGSPEKPKLLPITLGCDPELFLYDPDKRKFVPACTVQTGPVIPGTKHQPYKVEGGAVQVDGVALEFNIDPTDKLEVWVDRVNSVKATMLQIAREKLNNPRLTLRNSAVVEFKRGVFAQVPDESKELGCEPDFNALTGKVNPRPNPGKDFEFRRTGSGHIHIGWTNGMDPMDPQHFMDCRLVVLALEKYLNFAVEYYTNQLRKDLYGATGTFRPKPFGVEWRTPCNFWVDGVKNGAAEFMFTAVKRIAEDTLHGTHDRPSNIFSGAYSGLLTNNKTGMYLYQNVYASCPFLTLEV
jgi:hypothetical protein